MNKLTLDFYQREDVLTISQELLGKVLCTNFYGKMTSGIIIETEAYGGITDQASHAYGGRRTKRTEIMYAPGGNAYIYLCYGIHHLFNVVTNVKDVPHAVLIRAIEPKEGLSTMLIRRKKEKSESTITSGPGSLTQAMGITTRHSGISLLGNQIWIEVDGTHYNNKDIISGRRIGVQYAGEDASNSWRFQIRKKCSPGN